MATRTRIQMQKYEATVEGAVSDALSTLEELGNECREAVENMPESLQSGNRGETLSQTADELEYLSAPDCPECLSDVKVSFEYKPNRRPSRSDRRYEATRMLEAARDAAQSYIDDLDTEPAGETPEDAQIRLEKLDSERDEVEQYISELEEIVSTAEGVEFPGMYS